VLKEPGGQIAAEFAGALLALVEGDQLVLIVGVEHEVESSGRVGEKALSEFLAAGVESGLSIVHDGYSGWSGQRNPTARPSYPENPSAGTRLHPEGGVSQ
jgi:hypothetical protein